mmetsp:Transcript_79539/g.170503  ORF Transcript_79539/g.170503 Transcript_79539/m.170503 type:complete len:681 (-) Transcript_79539:76-2118(-)
MVKAKGMSKQDQESAITDMSTRQDEMEARLDKELADMQKALLAALAAEGQKTAGLIQQTAKTAEDALNEQSRIQADEFVSVRKVIEENLNSTMDRIDAFGPKLAALRADITTVDETTVTLGKTIEELRAETNDTIERVAKEAEKHTREVDAMWRVAVEEQAKVFYAAIEETKPPVERRFVSVEAEIAKLQPEIDRVEAAAKVELLDQVAVFQGNIGALREEVTTDYRKRFAETSERNETRFEAASVEAAQVRESLRVTKLVSDNAYSRFITWQMRGFKNRFAKVLNSDETSLFSPGFSVCSLPEMILELQVPLKDENPAVPLPDQTLSLPLPGSCGLRLWAYPGLQLVFRLGLGEGSSAHTKRFEWHFSSKGPKDANGRTCFEVLNFCQLNRAWVRDTDSIKVNFEMLEFRSTPELRDVPPGQEAGLDDILLTRLCISEALMNERVTREIVAVKNRGVRRIEWRLEGCQRLLEMCKAGESVDSPPFGACGLERIQFHFYPRGHDAEASSQPCAIYVSGPGRTQLRGVLWVGTMQRPLDHYFQRRGDVGGRPRFCLLQHQTDCNDGVNIALDLQEVEVDLPEVGSSLCLRQQAPRSADAPRGAGGDHGSRDATMKRDDTVPTPLGSPVSQVGSSPLPGPKGSLRMRREDPSKTEEFAKCVSLPTLNTRNLFMPLASKGRRS